MIYPINIKQNEFILLKLKPFSWQRIIPLTAGLSKGDTIKLIEVDSLNLPTGHEMVGTVRFLSNGDMIVDNNKSVLVYCENVSSGLSNEVIGGSLIIG